MCDSSRSLPSPGQTGPFPPLRRVLLPLQRAWPRPLGKRISPPSTGPGQASLLRVWVTLLTVPPGPACVSPPLPSSSQVLLADPPPQQPPAQPVDSVLLFTCTYIIMASIPGDWTPHLSTHGAPDTPVFPSHPSGHHPWTPAWSATPLLPPQPPLGPRRSYAAPEGPCCSQSRASAEKLPGLQITSPPPREDPEALPTFTRQATSGGPGPPQAHSASLPALPNLLQCKAFSW